MLQYHLNDMSSVVTNMVDFMLVSQKLQIHYSELRERKATLDFRHEGKISRKQQVESQVTIMCSLKLLRG